MPSQASSQGNNIFDIILWTVLEIYWHCIKFFWLTAVYMINPIPTWVLFRLKYSSVVVFMNQMLKNCSRSTPITSQIGHKNRKERKYFRNKTEIKLKCFQQASNYNGYVTVSGVIVESKRHKLDTNYICFS